MNTGEKKIHDRKKGSVMVEFALVLPIFVLFMVGIVEFSRVLMVQQVITNAAREGARAGSIYINDITAQSQAATISNAYLTASGVDASNTSLVTVDSDLITTGGLPAIQVLINYNYDSLLTGFIPGIPGTLTLSATVVMRREI